jgi:hypothetical protein
MSVSGVSDYSRPRDAQAERETRVKAASDWRQLTDSVNELEKSTVGTSSAVNDPEASQGLRRRAPGPMDEASASTFHGFFTLDLAMNSQLRVYCLDPCHLLQDILKPRISAAHLPRSHLRTCSPIHLSVPPATNHCLPFSLYPILRPLILLSFLLFRTHT